MAPPSAAAAAADTNGKGAFTEELGRRHMMMGQAAHDVCTTEAQLVHMRAKDQFIDEWQGYQENVADKTDWKALDGFVQALLASSLEDQATYQAAYRAASQTFKMVPSKPQLLRSYAGLKLAGKVQPHPNFEKLFLKKAVRSNSGVVVITVVTAPGPFSCPHDCHYCPNEPGQPRSYLSTEPAVSRANQNEFCPVRQFYDRAATLAKQGHHVDKVEIIVLGGTWSGYPWQYQWEFCRDLFFAANTFDEELAKTAVRQREDGSWAPTIDPVQVQFDQSRFKRDRLSIREEHLLNETSDCKIIGLTLETRPDYVSIPEVRRLRELGCTRVQIGIQHTDDDILKAINRGCTLQDCVNAVRILKQHCFKVDIHLMPDLPQSDPEKDYEMFRFVLDSPHLQADHWKIYPCEVTPFSAIERWFEEGSYVPYTERDPSLLVDLLVRVKATVHPWIRLNRVIRDIPKESIIAGNDNVNLRQVIYKELAARGQCCRCIRCREVRDWPEDASALRLVKRPYRSSEGDEIFISIEGSISRGLGGGAEQRGLKADKLRYRKPGKKARRKAQQQNRDNQSHVSHTTNNDNVRTAAAAEEAVEPSSAEQALSAGTIDLDNAPLYGLLRLRFNDDPEAPARAFPELKNCALIRELHVYGLVKPVRANQQQQQKAGEDVQHLGIGKKLMAEAERLAVNRGYSKIAVIAGVGVRNYYRKRGYEMRGDGDFLVKDLTSQLQAKKYRERASWALGATLGLGAAFAAYRAFKK